jgi:hypothetical protein
MEEAILRGGALTVDDLLKVSNRTEPRPPVSRPSTTPVTEPRPAARSRS